MRNILGTNECINCKALNLESGLLCYNCFKNLDFITNYNGITSIYAHNKLAKKLVKETKYRDTQIYLNFFTNILIYYIKWQKIDFDYIIPIPSDYLTLIKKSEHHNFLIAKKIASYFQKQILTNLLKCKRKKSQTSLSAKQRKRNLKDIFYLNEKQLKKISFKKIILFDDITTTGSTLENASNILTKNTTIRIYPLTLNKTYLTIK